MLLIEGSVRFKKMLIMTFFLSLLMGVVYIISYPNFFGINISNLVGKKYKSSDEASVLSIQEESAFEEFAKPIYGSPERIMVESLGIDLKVVPVGVDDAGRLETPENWNEAGWYHKGAKPGEVGDLLINAHYDDNYGRPAAFWKLKNVNVGDKVSVLDSYGRVFDYKVAEVYYLDINDPDRGKVFEPFKEGVPVMTAITCGGVWSYTQGTYDKRLVVNAELIRE